MHAAVAMRGITKRFPGVVANDHVDFDVAGGEVHALLGENGAGKTTLSNILTGLYRPDEGEIVLSGRTVEFHSPRDAIDAGIAMVHQHFRLVSPFTVAENVVLGDHRDVGRTFLLQTRVIEKRVAELSRRFGLAVDARARIWQLSLGEQQRVGILKALYQDARILILGVPAAGDRGALALKDVWLCVRAAEIVAIAGVAGNGQRELAETISGMRPPTSGTLRVCGRGMRGGDPREAIAAGIAYVPEDRLGTGLAPGLSVASNVVLKSYREPPASRGPLLLLRRIRELAQRLIDHYDVRVSGPDVPAWQLS